MKKVRNILLLLVTLLLTVAGAAMPYLASRAQDARVAQSDVIRALDAVSLTLWEPTEIGSVLQMAAGGDTTETYWPGETRMTAGEAAAAVQAAAEQLQAAGLLESWPTEDVEMVPVLMVSGDGEISAVIWEYREPYVGVYALLDDGSGKLVGIQGFSPRLDWVLRYDVETGGERIVVEDQPRLQARLEGWADFCRDYYGAARVICDQAEMGAVSVLRFLRPSGEEELRLDVVIWEDWTFLNSK